PRDLAEDMQRNPRVGHPRQPGVPEIVAPEVLVTELGHHLVPVRGITQHRSGDPPAPWSFEQPCVRIVVERSNASLHQLTDLRNERNRAGALALGPLVNKPSWTCGRLAAHGPRPRPGVDIPNPASGHLADASRRARRKGDNFS